MAKYTNAWTAIKNGYEAATGKAKPSASSKSLMSKPSGIEPACKVVDAVLAAKLDAALPAKATAAGDALIAKADAYAKVLVQLAGAEADPPTKAALKTMETQILKLVADARDDLEEHVEPVFVGTFKNQLPTGFDPQWLKARLPLQGFAADPKLFNALDMCEHHFVDNPHKLDSDARKHANFHRQVDAAINGIKAQVEKALQQAKDPRQAQLRKALAAYLEMTKPIAAKNKKAIDELAKKAKTHAKLAAAMDELDMR